MNWIFKRRDKSDFSDEKVLITIKQKRNFSGKAGDNVLILYDFDSKWVFDSSYRITYIKVKKEDHSDLIYTTIELSLIEKFDKLKYLDHYKYSLRRVTNFKYPHKHFIRQYNRIEEIEYEAILKDRIFYSRTIFGSIINNLHQIHRESFIIFISIKSPRILTSRPSLIEVINLLQEYLTFSILKPAQLLKELYYNVKELESNGLISVYFNNERVDNDENIKFSFIDENLQSNSIDAQVKIIESELSKLSDIMSELKDIDEAIERSFDRFFKNVRLPIYLI